MLAEQATLMVRQLSDGDLTMGFFQALSALKEVNLTIEESLKVCRARERAGVKTYVAIAEGQVLGTASLFIEPKFIHEGGLVGHIEDVAVLVSGQHQGIGAALVMHLIDHCRREGCYKVILDCETNVAPFYEKLGFHHWEQAMRLDLP